MIQLVKYLRDGRKTLLSKNVNIEMQPSGLMLRFPAEDRRKPNYVVLIDNDSIKNLVNELLEHLKDNQ